MKNTRSEQRRVRIENSIKNLVPLVKKAWRLNQLAAAVTDADALLSALSEEYEALYIASQCYGIVGRRTKIVTPLETRDRETD
jgi:putative ubiquitin-RnfH superfamily antitoxin RatB of RatAB toxin-antitoxin module